MATQQGVIKTFMASLDKTTLTGTEAVDEAVKACSDFGGVQAVINKMLADCKSYNNADSKNGWENFLLEKCGINLDNLDTGAITGSDAGGSTSKTTESIVPESGSLKKFTGDSFTVNGLKFKLAESFDNLSDKEKFIWQALYTWWAKESLNLIKISYGYSFSDSDATTKNITVKFTNDSSTTWIAWADYDDKNSNGKIDEIGLTVNMASYGNIDKQNFNGKSPNQKFYLDRTLAHEFTHLAMYAKVNYEYNLPHFITEGLAELNHGIDDERYSVIQYVAQNPSELSDWLSMSSSNNGGSGTDYSYEAGYIFLRYLAKQASTTQGKSLSNSTKNKSISGTANNDTLKNYADNVTIVAGKSNDYIKNSGGDNVKISGGDGADQIYSYGSKTSINTGKDDDFVYLYSNASSVTVNANATGNKEIYSAAQAARITTGAGNDYIYLYSNASKNTVNAGAGNNSINSAAQTAAITTGAGNDSILLYSNASKNTVNAGAGNDSISSAAQIALINASEGNDYIYLYSNASKNTVNAGAGNDSISSAAQIALINASEGNDYIYLYSNASKNTVNAGAGNDSIRNYSSNVVYKYKSGEGNDSIVGFNASSTLQIGGGTGTYSSTTKGKNIIVTVGEGKITLQGAAKLPKVNIAGKKVITNNKNNASVIGSNYADSIENYGSKSKINALAGNDFIGSYAANSSVNAGVGNDTIQNTSYGTNTTLIGGAGNDSILNSANAKIYGGAGADTITNTDLGSNSTLSGGAGNDYITSYNADKVSINGGEGNDTIFDYITSYNADKVSINGGEGNDTIFLLGTSKGITITGGKGNDTLWGDNGVNKFNYASGDGKDIIYGFDNTDMLKITGNFSTSYSKAKDEIYFKVGSTTKAITLSDFSATSFNVNGASYKISGSKLVKK